MLSVAVNVDGALRKINTAALATEDLSGPLAALGKRIKKRALGRFEQQSFPALADSTIKKRAAKGLHKLEAKLQGDLRKASNRGAATRSPRGMLARILGSPGMTSAVVGETKGVRNRTAVLSEFQRIHVQRVSKQRGAGGFQRIVGAQKLTLKQQNSLGARAQRAIAKEVGGPILGKLPRSLHVVVDGDRLTVIERSFQEWTDVHNVGGQAGKNAKEPKRETLVLDSYDLEVFIDILREHALAPFLED